MAGFRIQQEIMLNEEPEADDPQMMLQVERYADENAAAGGLQATYDRYVACDCAAGEVAQRDLPQFGDEAVAFEVAMPRGDAPSLGYLIVVRTGSYVSQVWLTSIPGETLERAIALAALQADCAQGRCGDRVALPAELLE
jgi:hypothetical protein